ncbi:Hypothetical predicted protein [Podarcis lilfordi]|uniref:Uncharacterized protein n=1 Tax=Podarcis lilfordi TaxID=74358 RepID=A0AA35PH85_9SAUR|nr:Hypothetical predicted protein [Podarcis lilfordi]
MSGNGNRLPGAKAGGSKQGEADSPDPRLTPVDPRGAKEEAGARQPRRQSGARSLQREKGPYRNRASDTLRVAAILKSSAISRQQR